MDSDDVRKGAVNDVLDLIRYCQDPDIKFYVSGKISNQFNIIIDNLSGKTIKCRNISLSYASLPEFIMNVVNWIHILYKYKIDIIHINYISWRPSLALAGKITGIPIVSRAGGDYDKNNFSIRWISRYLANCEAQAVNLLNSPIRDRVNIVGDLINVDRMCTDNVVIPFNKESNTIYFIFLGQLVERKGLHILIEAFERMKIKSKLLIIGGNWRDAGYPQEIKRKIIDCHLQDMINIYDHRDDAILFLKQSDVFVLPSLSEARPRSIIEAMLLGKCIVTTKVGGIPTLIEDNITGLLVPAADVESLAVALNNVAESIELRNRLGGNARNYAKNKFDPRETAENYVEIYKILLKNKREKSICQMV